LLAFFSGRSFLLFCWLGLGLGNFLLLSPVFDELGVLEAGDLVDVVADHENEFELVVSVCRML